MSEFLMRSDWSKKEFKPQKFNENLTCSCCCSLYPYLYGRTVNCSLLQKCLGLEGQIISSEVTSHGTILSLVRSRDWRMSASEAKLYKFSAGRHNLIPVHAFVLQCAFNKYHHVVRNNSKINPICGNMSLNWTG